MNKIITLKEAIDINKKWREQEKTVVLAGGCFDVLHQGHFIYLEKAKKGGDVLVVLLESDENVRRLKGAGRPVNSQLKRAEGLAKFSFVDYVILLPPLIGYRQYFDITAKLAPHIIAITEGDPKQKEKEIQAKSVGGRVVLVTPLLKNYSTTEILKNLL
ncbi:adenylyltransferase/cytidyltransferase family protein [Candidatus Microgenomates bacterium]|nr:adenylyltransferase/cytidyltransferase family protein [Candidatus Microgenomates bacterium]